MRGLAVLCAPAVWIALCSVGAPPAEAGTRLERIRDRGHLTCGVLPHVAGFASVDGDGRYAGFEIDICRALAAAIFGRPDQVAFVTAVALDQFKRDGDIDVVARRLTWTLRREAENGLLFGPVIFYDGAGFLVPTARSLRNPRQLAGQPICVPAGSETEQSLRLYFEQAALELDAKPFRSLALAADAFLGGECAALAADVSELAAERAGRGAHRDDYTILPETISKEPLALLLRQGDDDLFLVVRWTIYALIEAEELNVSSTNLAARGTSGDRTLRGLLGPETGRALGLDERWVVNVIGSVGNYGEIFARHLGAASPLALERGLNALWTRGGLMYAPPVR